MVTLLSVQNFPLLNLSEGQPLPHPYADAPSGYSARVVRMRAIYHFFVPSALFRERTNCRVLCIVVSIVTLVRQR